MKGKVREASDYLTLLLGAHGTSMGVWRKARMADMDLSDSGAILRLTSARKWTSRLLRTNTPYE